MVEITSEEQNEVKRMRITDGLRALWDNIKCTTIWIIGVPEEEKKEGYEKNFEEIIVEIFPNMEKEIVNQVQEAQRVPYRLYPRRNKKLRREPPWLSYYTSGNLSNEYESTNL